MQNPESVVKGTCHCGLVSYTFNGVIDSGTGCNCTVCRRYGAIWAYDFLDEKISVAGPTKIYIRGKTTEFHFCAECGCISYWLARSLEEDGKRRIAVNLRMAEPESVAAIPMEHFDGLDTFEDLGRDGKCVSDMWF